MPEALSQPAVSTLPVWQQVLAENDTGGPYDPTGDLVYMAFIPQQFPPVNPGDGDWNPATWVTIGSTYWASCLVGPDNGGVELAAGTYCCFVKVVDAPAVPVLPAFILNIT